MSTFTCPSPWTGPFRLLALPPELREKIYHAAMSPIRPIDTAQLPNVSPIPLRIPTVAQLSQQTRHEALHVLHNNRPIEISLHSPSNVTFAVAWAEHWKDHAHALPKLIFSGRIARCSNEFFVVKVTISDERPYFRAERVVQAASKGSAEWISRFKGEVLEWFEEKLGGDEVGEGRARKLREEDLVALIGLVVGAADSKAWLGEDDTLFSPTKWEVEVLNELHNETEEDEL